ncbi:hypothetical protein JQK15_20235 [Sphingobium sp. BHU LFT2]|uniref:hypothetical protein n=1 Tax=Sphingobium sp. BHU LFT2 TaxID=2807634 RepID=UPI001BEB9419|nr:hypothetical protein [Sphingobium sp. BHU LFT2]MBT2245845.1 hypothetical protein [Sphingobium sp. BHU LFT2]
MTAIATATAAQLAIWLKERWTTGHEARFSNLYAALFFEQYATDCSHRLGEKDSFNASGGHAGNDHGTLPELPPFPPEIEWKKVGVRLTEESFAFRVAVEAANAKIAYLYDFDPPDGGDHEVLTQMASLGLKALAVAERLRCAARLSPAPTPDPEYTTARHLTERQAHSEELRVKTLESQQASHAALVAGAAALPV